ncbi:MAG: hypothetical protein UR26_C0005G0021 [candidate division TM6 bacterium GW2011_GWF2_32_72]|nr:MAG: hypothetical protein UR26_C0005G0021 [candidate division TM6 bacterium GW2011_GWF2_32_72]
MDSKQIISKFNQGVNWNAIVYIFHKTTSAIATILFFQYLAPQAFSAWSNINSIIFLLLLWTDFGFRKSIPLFLPHFAQNKQSHRQFTIYTMLFQTLALIITTPIFLFTIQFLMKGFIKNICPMIIMLAVLIYVIEGCIGVVKLIYHAHFWQKQFNLLISVMTALETIANLITIFIFQMDSHKLFHAILLTKLFTGLGILAAAIIMLPKFYQEMTYTSSKNTNSLWWSFTKHSALMWGSNGIKSLTERNFLLPVFTHILGYEAGNFFKIASDGALLFYRSVIKTIGTTDTSLLAYTDMIQDGKTSLQTAFKKLISKIAGLCLPLFGILLFLLLQLIHNNHVDHMIFKLFFIMVLGYLLEAIFSPYERVLEIKREYVRLFIAYSPYCVMLIILFLFNTISYIGLINSLLLIHGVRLVSVFIMVWFARKRYGLLFPIMLISSLFLAFTLLAYTLHLIIAYYMHEGVSEYIKVLSKYIFKI